MRNIKTTDLADFDLRGDVKTCKSVMSNSPFGIKKTMHYFFTEFTELGVCKKHVFKWETAKYETETYYLIDERGAKELYEVYQNRSLISKGKYLYNEKGLLLEIIELLPINKSKEIYIYSFDGLIRSRKINGQEKKQEYIYDENGYVIKEIITDINLLNMSTYTEQRNCKPHYIIYLNDEYGKVLYSYKFEANDNILFNKNKYAYNSEGFLIESTFSSAKNGNSKLINLNYKYDKKGNFIYKQNCYKEGVIACEYEREITYYSD